MSKFQEQFEWIACVTSGFVGIEIWGGGERLVSCSQRLRRWGQWRNDCSSQLLTVVLVVAAAATAPAVGCCASKRRSCSALWTSLTSLFGWRTRADEGGCESRWRRTWDQIRCLVLVLTLTPDLLLVSSLVVDPRSWITSLLQVSPRSASLEGWKKPEAWAV